MAFSIYNLKENEQRTYTLTMWPRAGEKLTPKGGIIDRVNDVRLFYYGNGSYRSASNQFQFIFDYKGYVMNINIGEKIKDNDVYFSLIAIEGSDSINIDDIIPYLRESMVIFGNQRYAPYGEDISDNIHVNF